MADGPTPDRQTSGPAYNPEQNIDPAEHVQRSAADIRAGRTRSQRPERGQDPDQERWQQHFEGLYAKLPEEDRRNLESGENREDLKAIFERAARLLITPDEEIAQNPALQQEILAVDAKFREYPALHQARNNLIAILDQESYDENERQQLQQQAQQQEAQQQDDQQRPDTSDVDEEAKRLIEEEREQAWKAENDRLAREARRTLEAHIQQPDDVKLMRDAIDAAKHFKRHSDEHEVEHISASDPWYQYLIEYGGVILIMAAGAQYAVAKAAENMAGNGGGGHR